MLFCILNFGSCPERPHSCSRTFESQGDTRSKFLLANGLTAEIMRQASYIELAVDVIMPERGEPYPAGIAPAIALHGVWARFLQREGKGKEGSYFIDIGQIEGGCPRTVDATEAVQSSQRRRRPRALLNFGYALPRYTRRPKNT
eukprot:6181031-Pleurochrysis_carterae.AAC.5